MADSPNKKRIQNDSEYGSVSTAFGMGITEDWSKPDLEEEIYENYSDHKVAEMKKLKIEDLNRSVYGTMETIPSRSEENKLYFRQFSQETVTEISYVEEGREISIQKTEIEEDLSSINASDREMQDPNLILKTVTEESNLEMAEDLSADKDEPWYSIRSAPHANSIEDLREKAESSMSEIEIRKRMKMEKLERMAMKVDEMHQRQIVVERANDETTYWKPLIIILIIFMLFALAAVYLNIKHPKKS